MTTKALLFSRAFFLESCMKFDGHLSNLLWMSVYFDHQISPFGRTGGFHMLCCQGFEVKNYDFTLGRLAYGSLQTVQDPSDI
jgi:hypothetical protein